MPEAQLPTRPPIQPCNGTQATQPRKTHNDIRPHVGKQSQTLKCKPHAEKTKPHKKTQKPHNQKPKPHSQTRKPHGPTFCTKSHTCPKPKPHSKNTKPHMENIKPHIHTTSCQRTTTHRQGQNHTPPGPVRRQVKWAASSYTTHTRARSTPAAT